MLILDHLAVDDPRTLMDGTHDEDDMVDDDGQFASVRLTSNLYFKGMIWNDC